MYVCVYVCTNVGSLTYLGKSTSLLPSHLFPDSLRDSLVDSYLIFSTSNSTSPTASTTTFFVHHCIVLYCTEVHCTVQPSMYVRVLHRPKYVPVLHSVLAVLLLLLLVLPVAVALSVCSRSRMLSHRGVGCPY